MKLLNSHFTVSFLNCDAKVLRIYEVWRVFCEKMTDKM